MSAEQAAYDRAILLRTFVFHVRRQNLLPYEGRPEFVAQIEDLCRRSEAHLEAPVHPFEPLPEPKPTD